MVASTQFPNPVPLERSKWAEIPAVPEPGASNDEQVSNTILRLSISPSLPVSRVSKVKFISNSADSNQTAPEPTNDENWLVSYLEEGQQARAEELARRLELAVDILLEYRFQDPQLAESERLDALFDLYEREILNRDQVRRRGNLEPDQFYEELRSYRQRQAGR